MSWVIISSHLSSDLNCLSGVLFLSFYRNKETDLKGQNVAILFILWFRFDDYVCTTEHFYTNLQKITS